MVKAEMETTEEIQHNRENYVKNRERIIANSVKWGKENKDKQGKGKEVVSWKK